MLRLKSQYPGWLLALSFTQGGAVLVFMSFSGALPLIQAEWGLSNLQAGAIQSAGQVGYLLAVLVMSSLADFVDTRRLIISGVIWAGLSNLAFAFLAHDTASAVILRTLVGFGIAGIYMPGLKLISQKISQQTRGRAVGLFVAFFTLGTATSIAVGGTLASLMGWRMAFAVTTVGPLVGALISWRFLPKLQEDRTESGTPPSVRGLLSNHYALGVMLLYMFHAWEVLGLRSWLSAFLAAVRAEQGMALAAATSQGALVAGFSTVFAALATATVGAVSDRFGRLTVIKVVMGLGVFFMLFLGAGVSLPWTAVVLLSLGASFITNADSAVISTQLTEVVPQAYLGRALAVYSFLGFSAGSISPLVFGATLDFTVARTAQVPGSPWSWAFATFAVASVLGLAVVARLQREKGST